METRLITKTIKELADEYDNNIEQQRREIRRYDQVIIDLKKENESLKYRIELELWARARAEKKSDVSTFIMIISVIAMMIVTGCNILFIW